MGDTFPAGFGSLKVVTNCFWPRMVGHINGLFVLEDESGGCILRCRKNQTNGRMACWVSRSLKPPCYGDQPTRSWSAHDGSVTTQGTVSTLHTPGKLWQNVQNARNRMVLTYNDVGHTPKCPQIGVLLHNRATKVTAFLLHKFGVFSFGISSVFVPCNLPQKWECYACPKFWKFLPKCTVFISNGKLWMTGLSFTMSRERLVCP